MIVSEPGKQLEDGARALGVPLTAAGRERLLEFTGELARWGQAYNLTAVRGTQEMVTRHLLDSLAVYPFVHGVSVVDVGTGAGLPGLPLAVADPGRRFVLLDASGKKTRFVQHAAALLGLENVAVIRTRAEDYRPDEGFDTVTSRAFSSLAALIEAAGHLCAPAGRILAMKGRYPREEIRGLPRDWQVRDVHRLSVPGLDGERHVVICERSEE